MVSLFALCDFDLSKDDWYKGNNVPEFQTWPSSRLVTKDSLGQMAKIYDDHTSVAAARQPMSSNQPIGMEHEMTPVNVVLPLFPCQKGGPHCDPHLMSSG